MKLLMSLLFILTTISATAALNLQNGVAVKGYDVVEYFVSNKAIQGNPAHSHSHDGANYQFASKENLEQFKKSPSKYIPQYGGYCAYAAAKNYIYDIDPNAFEVVGGKLYLNANKSVQRTWQRDKADYIKKADKNWPSLKNR